MCFTKRPWLSKGAAVNVDIFPGAGELLGRGQISENLEAAEDFCRGTLLLDWKVGTGRQSYKACV